MRIAEERSERDHSIQTEVGPLVSQGIQVVQVSFTKTDPTATGSRAYLVGLEEDGGFLRALLEVGFDTLAFVFRLVLELFWGTTGSLLLRACPN